MTSSTPKRIVILPQADGEVVARHTELGKIVGQFSQGPSGDIYFSYCSEARRFYVNRSFTAFCDAAAVFNRCCESHADDDDTDDEVAWSLVASELKRELERIEPLGDPETSLWSATVHDTERGLLTLY